MVPLWFLNQKNEMAQIPRLLHSYLTSVNISKMCSRDYLPFSLLLWAQDEKICWNLRSNILIKKKVKKHKCHHFLRKGRIEFQNTLQVKYCEVKYFKIILEFHYDPRMSQITCWNIRKCTLRVKQHIPQPRLLPEGTWIKMNH